MRRSAIPSLMLIQGTITVKDKASTVDLLVLACLDQLLCYIRSLIYFFTKTNYLYEEVSNTLPNAYPGNHDYEGKYSLQLVSLYQLI
jgi:hypothetical protein